MSRLVHHLALAADWADAKRAGFYRISTRGRTLAEEGFIHACLADQIDGVAGRFYRDVTEPLVLLAIDITRLDCEVRLEVPPGAADAFPHLYGPLPIDAVVAVTPYLVPPSSATIARLHHAHIFASDLDATVGFWHRWFGARVVADETLVGSRNVMLAVGDGRLNVYDQPPHQTGRSGVHHLGVQVRDVDRLVVQMTDAGRPPRKAVAGGEGFRYVMIEAPDAILIEAFETVEESMTTASRPWFAWS